MKSRFIHRFWVTENAAENVENGDISSFEIHKDNCIIAINLQNLKT